MKSILLGKTIEEFTVELETLGLPKYSARQVCEWIYQKRANDIASMTNIAQKNRTLLVERYDVGFSAPIHTSVSTDGTEKYLFLTTNGSVEAVYIPEEDRATLCISSQCGCRYNCAFCMTGKQGFSGNLTAGEIVNQILSAPHFAKISNIVFMGMGEPLDNVEEVIKATRIITERWGLGWSPRRITISTVGILKNLEKVISETDCHIAISLHSPFDNQRLELMPAQKVNPIESVIKVLKKHRWTDHRRLSFEYIMFKEVNDTQQHIAALIKLLKGLPCRVNLIRYHEIPDLPFKPSSDETMMQFRNQLTEKGIFTTIRRSRGQDILAACGMLSTKNKPKH